MPVERQMPVLGDKLSQALKQYGLDYLYSDLGKIKDIGTLVEGVGGKAILDLLRAEKIFRDPTEVRQRAVRAFLRLGNIRDEFNRNYKKDDIEPVHLNVFPVCEAFKKTMLNLDIQYKRQLNFIDALLANRLDCDASSYVFMQLAMEKDVKCRGVELHNHYCVYVPVLNLIVETVDLLSQGKTKAQGKDQDMSGAGATYDMNAWKAVNQNYRLIEPKDIMGSYEFFVSGDAARTTNSGYFTPTDRKKFQEYTDLLKKNWEEKRTLTAFGAYLRFMVNGRGAWFLAPDNEKELFKLEKEGKRIFGNEAVNNLMYSWTHPVQMIEKKILNPYDWFKSRDE